MIYTKKIDNKIKIFNFNPSDKKWVISISNSKLYFSSLETDTVFILKNPSHKEASITYKIAIGILSDKAKGYRKKIREIKNESRNVFTKQDYKKIYDKIVNIINQVVDDKALEDWEKAVVIKLGQREIAYLNTLIFY